MLTNNDKLVFLFLHSKKHLSFEDLVNFLKHNSLPLALKWFFYWHGLHHTFSNNYFETATKRRDTEWYLQFWKDFLKDRKYRLRQIRDFLGIKESNDHKILKAFTKMHEKEWRLFKLHDEEPCEVCHVYPCMCNDSID